MNATEIHTFTQRQGLSMRVYFKCNVRKRKGQLVKACSTLLKEEFECKSIEITQFKERIRSLKKNGSYKLVTEPLVNKYTGNNIKIFNDRSNWYPWQRQIYNILFDAKNKIREPDGRKIISIVDETGNNGKSTFFKYLLVEHGQDIARFSYGTASQLRTRAINIGPKIIYIVDLARTKGKDDSELDLLAALEDIKNGLVTTAFYGRGETLLMKPPHIVISSNYKFNYQLLSADRWEIYEIKNKKLKEVNVKFEVRKEAVKK